MRDLDQSDVERDAENMREAMISELTEGFDPADLYGVCAMVCDAFFSGDAQEFAESRFLHDLIESTQSNPSGVKEKIEEALWIDFG